MDARGNNAPLIAAGGGLLLFISLFLKWVFEQSAWETFDLVDIILALIGLIAIGIGAMLATGNTTNLPSSPSAIVTTAGLISFSIVAAFILEGDELGFGIFLGLIGTIAMLVGGMQLAQAGTPPVRRAGGTDTMTQPPPPPPPPPASPTV